MLDQLLSGWDHGMYGTLKVKRGMNHMTPLRVYSPMCTMTLLSDQIVL